MLRLGTILCIRALIPTYLEPRKSPYTYFPTYVLHVYMQKSLCTRIDFDRIPICRYNISHFFYLPPAAMLLCLAGELATCDGRPPGYWKLEPERGCFRLPRYLPLDIRSYLETINLPFLISFSKYLYPTLPRSSSLITT